MKKIFAVLDSKDVYGKELSNIEVCKTLEEHGYDITILYNKDASERLKQEINKFRCIPIFFPRNIYGTWRGIKYVIAVIYSNLRISMLLAAQKPDVLLIPTEIVFIYLLPVLFFHKELRILFKMGDAPISYRKKDKGFAVRIYSWLWRKIVVQKISVVVSVSNFIKEKLLESGRRFNPKDVVIYNFPPNRFSNNTEQVEISKTGNDVVFGYLGRIVEDKGVLLLVEASLQILEKGYNMELYIGGNTKTDPIYYGKIKSLLNKSPQSQHIHFLDEITNIETFYSNIDVSCTPSVYEEPLGNVLVEAKAFRKPSIIFNKGGMPEIIEHQYNGYICENVSVESLRRAMMYYIENPQRCIIEGDDAKESIRRMGIDRNSYVHKWLGVMDSIFK